MPKEIKKEAICIFDFELSEDQEIIYLKFPNYPKNLPLKASRSFRLFDVLGSYNGPDVVFDFDQDGDLVAIEVLAE